MHSGLAVPGHDGMLLQLFVDLTSFSRDAHSVRSDGSSAFSHAVSATSL